METLRIFSAIVGIIVFIFIPPAFSQEAYKLEMMWGSKGTGDGQFEFPLGVAVDSLGNVYVADSLNRRIQKFDSNGNFVTKWFTHSDDSIRGPEGVTIDSLGDVYALNSGTWTIPISAPSPPQPSVMKFDSDGNLVTKWGSYGPGDSQFSLLSLNNPNGIAVDSSGNVYVADYYNNRIQKFDSNGNLITKWGSYGTGDGQFIGPRGVAASSSGNVYVADTGNLRIQRFNSDGTFITKWNIPLSSDCIEGLGADELGNVYVTTQYCCFWSACPFGPMDHNPVLKYDSNGNLMANWGDSGSGDGEFYRATGVAIDSSGNVYVADSGNNRIQKFSLILIPITLKSPSPGECFNACSSNSSPTFSWDVSDPFNDYKIQFSHFKNFTSFPFDFELTVQTPATQITIPLATWEDIMMIPGPSGGPIYWRIIGTRADGTKETSAVGSFIAVSEPAGDPNISTTGKRSKPTLTWETNCNKKFKAVFGSDASFTRKTTFTFNLKNPAVQEFSTTLTLGQWMVIKRLVKNVTGSTIYWYIESWDELGRYAKTDIMEFVIVE
jgi:sugar lactone lactonase YvrE